MSLSSHLAPDESPTLSSAMPPAWSRRLVAFGMDFILIFVILLLAALFLSKIYCEKVEREFHSILFDAYQLSPDDRFDDEKIEKIFRESSFPEQTLEVKRLIEVSVWILPFIYCFIGEFFFSGKSLGKATFGMQSLARHNGHPPHFLMALGRSMCKGLAILCILTHLFILGLLNFLFAFFNKERRCLHDFLTGSHTVQTVLPTAPQKVSEDS